MTSLHWACKRNHTEIINNLLSMNPNIDCKDVLGRTPLYFAYCNENIEIVKKLLLKKANPNFVLEQEGNIEFKTENVVLKLLITKFKDVKIYFIEDS